MYLVFMCPKCGALRYAKASQKTALCFACGCQVPIDQTKIRVLFKTEKGEEAVKAVQQYKMRRGKEVESRSSR